MAKGKSPKEMMQAIISSFSKGLLRAPQVKLLLTSPIHAGQASNQPCFSPVLNMGRQGKITQHLKKDSNMKEFKTNQPTCKYKSHQRYNQLNPDCGKLCKTSRPIS